MAFPFKCRRLVGRQLRTTGLVVHMGIPISENCLFFFVFFFWGGGFSTSKYGGSGDRTVVVPYTSGEKLFDRNPSSAGCILHWCSLVQHWRGGFFKLQCMSCKCYTLLQRILGGAGGKEKTDDSGIPKDPTTWHRNGPAAEAPLVSQFGPVPSPPPSPPPPPNTHKQTNIFP